ncbi:FtsX-like permease family protein [Glycomyces sp. NPDC046736]|uniref:FtsX-like permease family protein n=1 Tax=Glycomyces sp. NPDC046736 TaxID=3155615 RepID=UPI003409F6E2
MLASTRLAYRIARREALRYKGRSVLSIVLLGLPLLGVAIGASAYDTAVLSPEQDAELYLGETDAYIEPAYMGGAIVQHSWDERNPWAEPVNSGGYEDMSDIVPSKTQILAALPLGSWIAPYDAMGWSTEEIGVQTPNGIGTIEGYGYDLSDPIYEDSGLEYLEGGAPGRGEVVLSEDAASYLEVGVGDSLETTGNQDFEVTGIVEIPWNINGHFAIGPMFPDNANGWLVDTPEELTHEDALKLNELGMTVWAGSLLDLPPSGVAVQESYMVDEWSLMIYGLLVVVILMEVILLAGPAFAISAKRRTREFALMSASGATPSQIRNTVLAGGVLFGLLAAIAAVTIGIATVAIGRPLLEQIIGQRTPSLEVLPWLQASLVVVAIATGLLSALAAAISASRVNVVAALMGRTPGRKGSKRWLVLGLVMVGAGMASGFGGITLWSLPLMAAAIVLLQLGLVACTPALLAAAARLGRWMPLAPRMALREAGRNRGSAAPAIAAVLGVVAGGMAFTLVVTADNVRNESNQDRALPEGTTTLDLYSFVDIDEDGKVVEEADYDAGAAEAEAKLRKHLSDVELIPVSLSDVGFDCAAGVEGIDDPLQAYCNYTLVRPEANECSYWQIETTNEDEVRAAVEAAREDPRCDETSANSGWGLYEVPTSDDPRVVELYTGLKGEKLDEAMAVLDEGGVIVSDSWAIDDSGQVEFLTEIWDMNSDGEAAATFTTTLPAMSVDRDRLGYAGVFLSPGAAEELGMTPSHWIQRYVVETSTAVDGALVESIASDLSPKLVNGSIEARFERADYTDRSSLYIMLAVAALCAAITLGSTAVSTGLIIAEQRQEMTTLGAVGAAPGLRKRFAMWQTTMIALFGTLLGTIAGLIGYALIQAALNRPLQNQYPFETLYGWELPWANFGIMLLAVPILAAVGALVFTKARLPSERRLT